MKLETIKQISPTEVLNLKTPNSAETSIEFSTQLCYGNVAFGGYIAAVLQKLAVLYASQHPKLNRQLDVRTASTTFYRPVFPAKGVYRVLIRELHIGKAWSFLRVELFEGNTERLVVSTECNLTSFSIKGVTLLTGWQVEPLPTPINFTKIEQGLTDPNWILHHPGFYPNGWIRNSALIKYYVPRKHSPTAYYRDQWIVPGWDCTFLGSRDPNVPEARWTTEMLPFAADCVLPAQDDHFGQRPDQPYYISSSLRIIQFAEMQEKARDIEKIPNWRELPDKTDGDASRPDGYLAAFAHKHLINSTINMTIELKKSLPSEGVRWLYVRSEVKRVIDGRMDLQALIFDEDMDLVAVKTGVDQLTDPKSKQERGTTLTKSTTSRL